MSVKKKVFISLTVIALVIFLSMYVCNSIIVNTSKGKLYTDVQLIPYNKVGLLLGTSKYAFGNRINPFYWNRLEAAGNLLQHRKIKYLVISGDNSRKDYNEPESMREDLIRMGLDSTVIYLDYAGFRTFDSVVRLKEIFGQDSVTIISQQFHNERAIYIASKEGINAVF
jgi:SanA protein